MNWIKTSERLPDKNGKYLVLIKYGILSDISIVGLSNNSFFKLGGRHRKTYKKYNPLVRNTKITGGRIVDEDDFWYFIRLIYVVILIAFFGVSTFFIFSIGVNTIFRCGHINCTHYVEVKS